MTLEEASERFCIDIENLSYYEKNGLLICEKLVNNVPDYTEEELHKVGMIHDAFGRRNGFGYIAELSEPE